MGKFIWGKHGDIKARETRNGDWIVYDSPKQNITVNNYGGSNLDEHLDLTGTCGHKNIAYIYIVGGILGVLATIGILALGWILIWLAVTL